MKKATNSKHPKYEVRQDKDLNHPGSQLPSISKDLRDLERKPSKSTPFLSKEPKTKATMIPRSSLDVELVTRSKEMDYFP
jgi:hypothetical protein